MDAELTEVFIEEAESYLPTLRGGILLCAQSGEVGEEMEVSMRQAHTIKGAALMTGFDNIGEIARTLEMELRKVVKNKMPLTEEQSRNFLDMVAKIEAEIFIKKLDIEENFLDTDDFLESFEDLKIQPEIKPIEFEGLDIEPEIKAVEFENLEIEPEVKAVELKNSESAAQTKIPEEIIEDSWDEDFEIDAEMLEVFALEAEDLLQSTTIQLATLADAPNDREALLQIRRNAHTLKGSAGIVGLHNLSHLAHRVEDLLDYIWEKEIEGNEKIFELLLTSTDCLNALATGENSEQIVKKIGRLEQEFDKILELLKNRENITVQSKIETQIEDEILLEIEEISAVNLPKSETVIAPTITDTAETNSQTAANQNRSFVRVSYDRLSDLINLVREMVVSRSVFEQRLAEFGTQIEELRGSTRRLNSSTGRLETEFEAEMLGGENSNVSFSQAALNESFQTQFVNPNAFDSLEFDRYTEFHQITRELIETAVDNFTINSELDQLRGKFETLLDYQNRLVEEMRDSLLRLRMVNFDSLTVRLQRTVKFTAEQEEKFVELVIEGGNMEIDTQILDALVEPLLHLLRNAVAHGIEPPETRRLLGKSEIGKLQLRVRNEGMHIVVSVSDDGRGISSDALREKAVKQKFISQIEAEELSKKEIFDLAFLPGVTTAEEINQVSGRGVGLNIVKTGILRQQGSIFVESELQKGTTFTMRLPMSMAVNRAILVKSGNETFAFPLRLVKQVAEIPTAELGEKFVLGETEYKVEHLSKLLDLPPANAENILLLLIKTTDKECVLAVEQILKTEEVVIKPLGGFLSNLSEYIGATVLGDGKIVPVLDLASLLKTVVESKPEEKQAEVISSPKTLSVMIVDDSPSVRKINSKIIKNAGMQSFVARDGLEALEVLQLFQEPPDVILTDVEMPRMNGYELLAALKQQENLRNIPVIMITSRAGDKHRQKAFDIGVSEYVTKPYEETALIEIIRKLTK